MVDDSFSVKEVLESNLSDMKEVIANINNKLEEISVTTFETKIQTTKTNGRVTSLEDWSVDAKKVIESNIKTANAYKRDRAIIYSLIGFIVLCGPFVYSLLQSTLKNQEYTQARQAVADVLATYNVNGK